MFQIFRNHVGVKPPRPAMAGEDENIAFLKSCTKAQIGPKFGYLGDGEGETANV
jgi:hypothetical protein